MVEIKKEQYINLRMTKEEAETLRMTLGEMLRVLETQVYKGEKPPTIVEEFIEDLAWTKLDI